MVNFIFLLGILNAIGGRWTDIVGIEHAKYGRLAFRCILPALAIAFYAHGIGYNFWQCVYIAGSALIGFSLWFPWGWDFAAVHGREDLSKWPVWMQKLASRIYPSPNATYQRGTLCMCLRGMYLYPMYVLMTAITSGALVMGLISGSQGLIYRLCGYLLPERFAVMTAEFLVGALVIGFPLFVTLTGGIYETKN